MSWLFELHKTQPIAHAVGLLAFVCVLGMALGSLKFRGIGLAAGAKFFATVYPLTTLLRILSAQVLAIMLFR